MTLMNRNSVRKFAALGAAAASISLPLAGVEAFGSTASAQPARIVLTEEDYYTGGTRVYVLELGVCRISTNYTRT